MNNDPFIRDFVTLNKSVINYLPRCSYHLLYLFWKGFKTGEQKVQRKAAKIDKQQKLLAKPSLSAPMADCKKLTFQCKFKPG